jgi:hypothetical protein
MVRRDIAVVRVPLVIVYSSRFKTTLVSPDASAHLRRRQCEDSRRRNSARLAFKPIGRKLLKLKTNLAIGTES